MLKNRKRGEGLLARSLSRRQAASGSTSMSITSLLDIMTILLVFMLKNFAADPTHITSSDELDLADSTMRDLRAFGTVALTVTDGHILVDDRPVVKVSNGRVTASAKRDGEDGYFITPVFDALQEISKRRPALRAAGGEKGQGGRLLFVADRRIPFRLLTEVLYTAGQASYDEYEFAVLSL